MGRENGRHLKDWLLLGGAVRYIRLFCLPRHSYVTATALCKQVPDCVRVRWVNFQQYFICLCQRIFNHCNVL